MDGLTDKDVKTLQSEIAALRDDLGKITGTVRDITQREVRHLLKDAKGTASDLEDQAREKLGAVTDAIESKPITAAAASFGVGFLLGLLLNGRRSS